MARKSKYDPERVQKIIDAIKLGATHELAANYAGVSVTTFYEWKSTKAEFAEAIKAAEGLGAIKWLEKIEAAANEHWQAAAWKLERRYPDQYGRQIITQQVQGRIIVDLDADTNTNNTTK